VDNVQDLIDQQDAEHDETLDKFKKKARRSLRKAEIALLLWLASQLKLKGGIIAPNASNVRILDAIPEQFTRLANQNGYESAVDGIRDALLKQDEWHDKIAAATGAGREIATREQQLRNAQQDSIINPLDMMPQELLRRALFVIAPSFLGSSLEEVASAIGDWLETLPDKLGSQASTAISTYYRAIQLQHYRVLEATAKQPLRFRYAGPGPGDPVIRPFCRDLMAETLAGRTWTLDEIEAMDNGQGLPVITCGGGYNCRHQWIPAEAA
jgi:hypothetical protein